MFKYILKRKGDNRCNKFINCFEINFIFNAVTVYETIRFTLYVIYFRDLFQIFLRYILI